MELRGRVIDGVMVLDGGATLPEGTVVIVSCEPAAKRAGKKRRVVLPLVKSEHPGSLLLTNECIARLLEEEDVAQFARFFKQSPKAFSGMA